MENEPLKRARTAWQVLGYVGLAVPIVLIWLVFFASVSEAAVTKVASSCGQQASSSQDFTTSSVTLAAGESLALVDYWEGGSSGAVSLTWNGAAFEQMNSSVSGNRGDWWILTSPGAGSYPVVLTGSSGNTYHRLNYVLLTGVVSTVGGDSDVATATTTPGAGAFFSYSHGGLMNISPADGFGDNCAEFRAQFPVADTVYSTTSGNWAGYAVVSGSAAPAPGLQVVSATATMVSGTQTLAAVSVASNVVLATQWVLAVRLDALDQHHYWYCTPTNGTCDTTDFAVQHIPNGLWRISTFGDTSGGLRVNGSNYRDVQFSADSAGYLDGQPLGAHLPLTTQLPNSNAYVTQSGTDVLVGFNLSASATAAIGQYLSIDANGCASVLGEDATSTLCTARTWYDSIFAYPLISWPAGIASATWSAWRSASSTSSVYSLTLDAHGAGLGWIPSLTVIDSASETAGVGAWYNKTGHDSTYYRPLFAALLWLGWVWALAARARRLFS